MDRHNAFAVSLVRYTIRIICQQIDVNQLNMQQKANPDFLIQFSIYLQSSASNPSQENILFL